MAFGISSNFSNNLLTQSLNSQSSTMSGLLSSISSNKLNTALTGIAASKGLLVTNSATAVENQQAFNRTELALKNAASPLNASNATSVFNTKTATSATPAAVTATLSPTAKAGDYNVKVDQLAAGQKVQGATLSASATSAITTSASGYGQISITTGGKEKLVSFKLNGTESNEQALGKIASAVNSSGSGVTAKVAVDATGNAKLSFEGKTGAANTFTVKDTVGNAAATAGVTVSAPATDTNVTQQAQNAKFSVNGTSYQTATNQATAGTSGITYDFKQTTASTVKVTVASNSADVEKAARAFVTQYNDTLTKLKGNTAAYSQQSAATLNAFVSSNKSNLSAAGINVGTSGELKIDEAKFKDALSNSPEKLKAAFNTGGGLARLVQTESERAINTSLATPVSGGFAGLSSASPSYGISANQLIAQSIGLFMNTQF